MKTRLLRSGVVILLVVVLWVFVGVERIVGDHEMGVSWEPFLKHKPSLQMRFINPAQKGLEIVPLEALSPSEQGAFREFCAVRFGVADMSQCLAHISDRAV